MMGCFRAPSFPGSVRLVGNPSLTGLRKGCSSTDQNQTTSIVIHYFRPTTANFQEPSGCRFSTRTTPCAFTVTGSSFDDILYAASALPTSIAHPPAIWTSTSTGAYLST